jgi:hydrogenase maturation protease
MTPSRWLVLGLGNRLAGADGFGPAVVEALAAAGDRPPGVDLVDAHADLLGSLDRFEGREHVVLVDAVLDANGPGVAVFDEETFSSWETRSTGVHGLSAIMAVKLFRRLQPPGDPALPAHPRITLVAYLVSEAHFLRPLEPAIVQAGIETVRALLARLQPART